MTKTHGKFQRNRPNTVGGVAHTRYPLSIHFDSKTPKMTKFNLREKRHIEVKQSKNQAKQSTKAKQRKGREGEGKGKGKERVIVKAG